MNPDDRHQILRVNHTVSMLCNDVLVANLGLCFKKKKLKKVSMGS